MAWTITLLQKEQTENHSTPMGMECHAMADRSKTLESNLLQATWNDKEFRSRPIGVASRFNPDTVGMDY